jgi:lipopolysaccharide transport system permease protein
MSQAIAERILRPRHGFIRLHLSELWHFRELLALFTWRDVLVRYKQTYLGIAWAVLQPLLTMLVLTFVFGRMANLRVGNEPYAILTLAALLPWQFFANALTESSASLVGASRIISKVYFPRLIIPVSAVLGGLVDAFISFALLLVFMPFYGVDYSWRLLLAPLCFLLAMLPAFAGGIWLSALNVKYRDVRYIVPFITRIGIYLTPVGFVWARLIPEKWQFIYSLNPLVGAVDVFRWCVLGPAYPIYFPGLWASVGLGLAALFAGLIYFRSVERKFADLL